MTPYYDHAGITIYNGDCREVLPSLEGLMDAIFDPPYGIGINYGPYDDDPLAYWEWFLPCVDQIKSHVRTMVFTHRNKALLHLKGYDWVGVWYKPGAFGSRIGNSFVLPHWEPIFMYGIHHSGTKSRYMSDVIECMPQKVDGRSTSLIGRKKWAVGGQTSHPCPKPVALFKKLIEFTSQDDATILDPFMGSGTTLVAAKALGRKAIGIEINKDYCDIAISRLQQEVMAI